MRPNRLKIIASRVASRLQTAGVAGSDPPAAPARAVVRRDRPGRPGVQILRHSAIAAVAGRLTGAGRAEDDAGYYGSAAWFANFAATCLDPGDQLCIDEIVESGSGRAVMMMRLRPDRFGPLGGRMLAGLSNFYSCRFPLTGLDGAADPSGLVEAWARSLRRSAERPDRLRFDALAAPSRSFDALAAGLRRAGYLIEPYPQFVNWYVPVAPGGFAAYWAARDGQLRNTVERKEKALRRRHAVTIETIRDPAAADRAIAAYQEVHAASWKPPEPYPDFIPGLIRSGLADGAVGVGALTVDGTPAAVQLWVTAGRRATIFKLCYAEAVRPLSAGSILTRHLIREAFEAGTVDEIDFGWGDDRYKRDWLPERRVRWGLFAYDPWTLCGLGLAARNLLPRAIARLRTGRGRRDRRPEPMPAPESLSGVTTGEG